MGDNYSALDKLLHRLSLQVVPIAELSFDIDQRLVAARGSEIANGRHVFVAGMARSGTTMLMRRFHATGQYRSLTYRDMPFVLAPNLWRRLRGHSQSQPGAVERAHGDEISIDVDSPECFDEVFWRIFSGDQYIRKTHLRPHSPDTDVKQKFVQYVAAILAAQENGKHKYLSKNNNNVLRLRSIREMFPNALIVVPFRRPLAQAGSLHRQHHRFLQLQNENGFIERYMRWLAHHEFGRDHRPFCFGNEEMIKQASYDKNKVDYWLGLWHETYLWLDRSAPEDVIFVCYEELCDDRHVWAALCGMAGISPEHQHDGFRKSRSHGDIPDDGRLLDDANAVYARLVERGRAALRY